MLYTANPGARWRTWCKTACICQPVGLAFLNPPSRLLPTTRAPVLFGHTCTRPSPLASRQGLYAYIIMVALNMTAELFTYPLTPLAFWSWQEVAMSALKTLGLGFLSLFSTLAATRAQNIVLTNDDGWAVAQIRAQFDALEAAGHNVRVSNCRLLIGVLPVSSSFHLYRAHNEYQVILSAPAQDQSGTGSSSATPTPLTEPCEFNSCPIGSPAEGFNASDRKCCLFLKSFFRD